MVVVGFDADGHIYSNYFHIIPSFKWKFLLFYLTPLELHRQGNALSMAGGTKQDGCTPHSD